VKKTFILRHNQRDFIVVCQRVFTAFAFHNTTQLHIISFMLIYTVKLHSFIYLHNVQYQTCDLDVSILNVQHKNCAANNFFLSQIAFCIMKK